MNKKTNFPDLERLPPHNHFKHFFNWLWNKPRWIFEGFYERKFLKINTKVNDQHKKNSNIIVPGIIAYLYYTGSILLVLFFFLPIYILIIFIEFITLKFSNNNLILTSNNLGINLWQSWNEPNTSNIKNINSLKINGISDLLSDSAKIKIEHLKNDSNWIYKVNKIYFDEIIKKFKQNKLEFVKIYFSRIFSLYFWFINY